MQLTSNQLRRFWSKISKSGNGCWFWNGWKKPKGYGEWNLENKKVLAHRISWIISFGDILKSDCICHRCDNPSCVNPAHLFKGSIADNNRDMFQKKRDCHSKGTAIYNGKLKPQPGDLNGQSKLTWQQVSEIRNRYDLGNILMRNLAQEFGVKVPMISKIVNNKNWKQVKLL